ncbi:UNVERIFIED_CONTAM: hypothetical protein Sangu_0999400 [Sesamum angustifolium]|uniref:Uncharacterized protein n=1 Tax=Sesamum angustifolium TaxID=2727405 RepID=A0AAW2PFB4_9LAMI
MVRPSRSTYSRPMIQTHPTFRTFCSNTLEASLLSPPQSWVSSLDPLSKSMHFPLSTAAILGPKYPRTLCLLGCILEHEVTVLIDSDSSHKIVQPCVAEYLGLFISLAHSFLILVGNKDTLHYFGVYPDVVLSLPSHHFSILLYVIPVLRVDIILGVQCWRPSSLSFSIFWYLLCNCITMAVWSTSLVFLPLAPKWLPLLNCVA